MRPILQNNSDQESFLVEDGSGNLLYSDDTSDDDDTDIRIYVHDDVEDDVSEEEEAEEEEDEDEEDRDTTDDLFNNHERYLGDEWKLTIPGTAKIKLFIVGLRMKK
ncbi:hypothetical protein L0F63_001580, partial [Massospora cicadina]